MEKQTIQQARFVHLFDAVKFNKQDTIYKCKNVENDSIVTEQVKVERFQGYSLAYNLGLYFRLRDASSWAKSTKLTGLFKTSTPRTFYGDAKEKDGRKTLFIFKIDEVNNTLRVVEFKKGFYPHKTVIEHIAKSV